MVYPCAPFRDCRVGLKILELGDARLLLHKLAVEVHELPEDDFQRGVLSHEDIGDGGHSEELDCERYYTVGELSDLIILQKRPGREERSCHVITSYLIQYYTLSRTIS